MRIINSTYAYHPGNEKADLKVATTVLAPYLAPPLPHVAEIDARLEWDVKQNGIVHPLQLYTNGVVAHLSNGSKRLRLAQQLGIKTVPLQIIPDSFRRFSSAKNGLPTLHPVLAKWVENNLWAHDDHTVTRHVIGGGASSIQSNKFTKCRCSCGAYWKEDV